MKQVIRYEAEDGEVFDTQEECEKHEKRSRRIKELKELMGREPFVYFDNCDWKALLDFIDKEVKAAIEVQGL